MATFGIPEDDDQNDVMSFNFKNTQPYFRLKAGDAFDEAPASGAVKTPSPRRSKSDIEQTYATWKQAPTPQNGAVLFRQLDPFVKAAVQRHTGGTSAVNIGRAKSLLIDALPRYDGRASMATFVDRQLQPMQRWSAKHKVGVRITHGYSAERKMLNDVESELIDELGRHPSRAEIADKSGLPLARIQKILSLQLPVPGEKSFQGGSDFSEAADQAVESDNNMWLLAVYYGLNPVNQVIMEHTLGLNGAPKFSNQDIAKRLRITPGAVSQRKNKIQAMLDRGS